MSNTKGTEVLTSRQLEVLTFIAQYWEEHRFAPSVEEIMLHLGSKSSFGVRKHLEELRVKGMLHWKAGLSRTTVISDRGQELLTKKGVIV